MLTINALAAADSVLIPLQCEFLSLEGLVELHNTINRVKFLSILTLISRAFCLQCALKDTR